MEVSVIGNSQVKICGSELATFREVRRLGEPLRRSNKVSFLGRSNRTRRWAEVGAKLSIKAALTEPVRSVSSPGPRAIPSSIDSVKLFVGLPLDAVSGCNSVNHAKAIAAGLRALKLLGVDGVELPVWWGVVEKEAMGKYNWSGYLALAEMVRDAGLKLHVSLCFHACRHPEIPLPEWVSMIGESQPDIYYKDRSGQHYRDCLSLAVDDLPVFDGKTPFSVFHGFCESFKSAFSGFMGTTIAGITIGLGPDGELRYPSHHRLVESSKTSGVGEFQCYDKNMLNLLKRHAEASGNPLWGLGGPHDAPGYDQFPNSTDFFKDHGGSWESPYGNFFLSWYTNELLAHGDRLLSMASTTFSEISVPSYGRVPLIHSWYNTRSHAAELTAGVLNTENSDGYDAVTEMFARNSCKMILPGMDQMGEHQPRDSFANPEKLFSQIGTACRKHGVKISGQNTSLSKDGLDQIKKSISGEDVVELFMYQRMGAEFFSPEHFPSFAQFVRSLSQLDMHSDDLPEEAIAKSPQTSSASNIQMQTA